MKAHPDGKVTFYDAQNTAPRSETCARSGMRRRSKRSFVLLLTKSLPLPPILENIDQSSSPLAS